MVMTATMTDRDDANRVHRPPSRTSAPTTREITPNCSRFNPDLQTGADEIARAAHR
jgi:hypothetical protein